MKRRSLLASILAVGAAPAIVRASSLMVLPPPRLILPQTLSGTQGSWSIGGDRRVYGSTTGRVSCDTPQLQDLPRNWPIQAGLLELRRETELRRNAMLERLRLTGGDDFARIERRLIWQFD